jgi:hypothetical protein
LGEKFFRGSSRGRSMRTFIVCDKGEREFSRSRNLEAHKISHHKHHTSSLFGKKHWRMRITKLKSRQ